MRGGSNRMLSPEQVAALLGVSRNTVYRNWKEWGLQGVTLGRLLRFPERGVDNFIDRHTA